MPHRCFQLLAALKICALLLVAPLYAFALAAPAVPSNAPDWSLAIDSRTTAQWLSVRNGTAYSLRDSHVIAIDLATGRIRWVSAAVVEGRPALGGRTLYAPITNGIVALDAATGREIGRAHDSQTPELTTTDFVAIATLRSRLATRVIGLRDGLHQRWQRELGGTWNRSEDIGRDVVLLWRDDPDGGPLAQTGSVIAFDARNGNALAAAESVQDYVGRDGRKLWFSVAGGGLESLDLDTSRHVAIHNAIVRGAVRVEGRNAVAVIGGHLNTLSLPDGRAQRLAVDGRWVGGPANGTIFIARSDGIYAQRLAGGRPTRLATNTSDTRFVTAYGNVAYFAANDGSLIAADLLDLRHVRRYTTACRFVEGVHAAAKALALVHCDDDRAASRLYALRLAGALR